MLLAFLVYVLDVIETVPASQWLPRNFVCSEKPFRAEQCMICTLLSIVEAAAIALVRQLSCVALILI